MKIRRPGGISGVQLGLVVVLGVLGGIYIYRPLLLQYKTETSAESSKQGTL